MRYEIEGEPFPVVECELGQGESMVCEAGRMAWMSPTIEMGTSANGGLGKMFGRSLSGERMFQNVYTARKGSGTIAFSAGLPGEIRALDIGRGNDYIVQKRGFLASTPGVELSAYVQERAGAGLFGGEGFILQRLSGRGTAFVELGGHVKEYGLAPGQEMVLSTGFLAMMTASCTMTVRRIRGTANVFLGGEGLFNAVVTGPGRVWVQTMPASVLASAIIPYLPKQGSSQAGPAQTAGRL